MEAVEILVLVAAVTSSLLFALTSYGFRSARHAPGQLPSPRRVSVIIAARDEQANIGTCLQAIAEQDYPSDLFEVVVADDRSTDGTAEAARDAFANGSALQIVRIDAVPEGISPKKHALTRAVEASTGELLLFTDADCIPEPGWVSSMATRFGLGADAVIGLAPLTGRSLPARFASFDAARTAFLSVGFAGLGIPYMAVGRNWGCTRRAFDTAGGYADLASTLGGDDDLLLQRLVRGGARVLPCTDRGSMCASPGPVTFRALIRRRLRHLSVGTAYRGRGAAAIATLTLTESATVFGGLALMALPVSTAPWVTALLLYMKLWYDMRFLHPVRRLYRDSAALPPPPLLAFHEFAHVVSSLVLGVMSSLVRPRW